MKLPPHIVRLYLKTARKYNKTVSRLHRETTSAYQRKTFLHKLRKLLRALRELEAQVRIATASATVVLLLNASPVQGQDEGSALGPFVLQDRLNNPLREPLFNESDPALAVIDYDKDGDFDVVLGAYDYWYGGHLRYFENLTAQGSPLYIEKLDKENPFISVRASTVAAAPAFSDIDGDGDMDLFVGQNGWDSYEGDSNSGVEYYRNDDGKFSRQTGQWNEVTKEGNPLENISLGQYVKPAFVDFDKDGDTDVLIGSDHWTGAPDYLTVRLHYYVNNGAGTFTSSPITINGEFYPYRSIAPAVSDIDRDGDYDLLVGSYNYGQLIYLNQVSPGSFQVEWDEWDAETKKGNPFGSFDLGANSSPVFIDFNQDGLLDVFVADEPGYYKYSDNIINYYENKGDNVFVEKFDLENPFGGVYVHEDAAPLVMDLDGDSDLDALIGNKYNEYRYDYESQQYIYLLSTLAHYENDEDVFVELKDEDSAFGSLELQGNFVPQLADVDGDGDLDLVSANFNGSVVFFRNDDGTYTDELEISPFSEISVPYYTSSQLVDIDNDKDFDLFVANDWEDVHYFQNTGTADDPAYTELTGDENPLAWLSSYAWYTPQPHFTDIDHDGDFDVVFSGASQYNVEAEAVLIVENIGTAQVASFEILDETVFENVSEEQPRMYLVDYDGDGDLDAFAGNENGTVSYLKNQNIPVTTNLSGLVALYENGADPIVIDPGITLSDVDNDHIVQATVAIENYQAGEILGFTQVGDITGTFDASTGVLTFRGKDSLEDYQELLQTVTFETAYEAGRRVPSKKTVIGKNITFAVYDQDFTDPTLESASLEVFINDPPAVGTRTINITAGGSANLDLKDIISDPNGSADLDLTSLHVITDPGSGAVTSINANGILTIDYDNLAFMGTETLTIEVCDLDGICAQNTITLVVSNTAPVIEPEPISTPAGVSKSLNLMSITSDVDGNLNPNAFTIVSQPLSGAVASVEVTSQSVVNLLLNYENITFHGTDEMTIRACDFAGACSENVLHVDVDVDDAPGIIVFNAIAPNSSGDNKFMRITGLPEVHKVSVFNRWGDKVFNTDKYQNGAFRGETNSGNPLPSGTYFYTIEIPGEKMISGYLTLKQ